MKKRYFMAKMPNNAVAYCDHEAKILMIYDESMRLRVAMSMYGREMFAATLFGDDYQRTYCLLGPKLGTAFDDMQACFDIAYTLNEADVPSCGHSLLVTDLICSSNEVAGRLGGFKAIDAPVPVLQSDILKTLRIHNNYYFDYENVHDYVFFLSARGRNSTHDFHYDGRCEQ